MIRLSSLEASPSIHNEAQLRIACLYETYGVKDAIWRYYVGDGGSTLARMDATAFWDAGDDAEEAALFLAMDSEVQTVRTSAAAAALLIPYGFAVRTGELLAATKVAPPNAAVHSLSPQEVYPLLSATFGDAVPPWDAWYADVLYRTRRDRFRAVGIHWQGQLASAAMTTAEAGNFWLVGGVATAHVFQGQGCATACVAALCEQAKKEGKSVWLAPETAALRQWYLRLGFTPCGTWGEAVRL